MSIGLDAPWILGLLPLAGLAWAGRASRLVRGLLAGAVALLVLAASGPWAGLPRTPRIALLVDVSPSTRTASWRDPVELRHITATLARAGRVSTYSFADGTAVLAIDAYDGGTAVVAKTRAVTPAQADVAVLLTDGRLDLTPLGPVAFLIDPALDQPGDHRVTQLTYAGDRPVAVASDEFAIENRIASVAPGDAWPENDRLALPRPAPSGGPRLWLGDGPVPPTFEPYDLARLASASVLATDAPLSDAARRWVSERGGLLILSGPEAVELDAASPLSVRPPRPDARWTILLDTSGSMVGRAFAAVAALRRAAVALPDETPVAVFSFAATVASRFDGTAATLAADDVAIAAPSGPTNLAAALQAARERGGDVLAITDGGAADFADEAAALARAGQRLHILHIGDDDAENLRTAALATGGTFAEAGDTSAWVAAIEEAFRAGARSEVRSGPSSLTFGGVLRDLGTVVAGDWRQAWPRDGAVVVAEGDGRVARWRVGVGEVVASSALLPPAVVTAIADRRAIDPRAEVEWQDGPDLIATVYAPIEADVRLRRDGDEVATTLVQPGVWRATITGERAPAVASVWVDGRLAGRRATAGRYAPEYEAIGNDHAAMRRLGEVVARVEDVPIPRVIRRVDLTLPPLLLGGLLAAAGLIFWSRGPATAASTTARRRRGLGPPAAG